MHSLRTWVAWSAVAGVLLVSPALLFLTVMAAEVLIDGLMEGGVTRVSAIAIGAIGWVQFRRIWRSEIAQLSGSKEVSEAPPIAAPPG
jgi:ABC-type dipeptide/oligopeptide/nickel transport system permease subunit